MIFFSSSETAGRFQNGDPKERTGADADAGKLSRLLAVIFFFQEMQRSSLKRHYVKIPRTFRIKLLTD